jgi:hypothetical protein
LVFDVTVGAVNSPLDDTVPLETVHVTAVLEVFVTEAWNCAVAPEFTSVLAGDTVTPTTAGTTEMLALADLVESATLVAVSTTLVFDVTVGAVKSPLEETLPDETVQVTAVSDVPVTDA